MSHSTLPTSTIAAPRESGPALVLVAPYQALLWGLTPAERHRRAFARAGAADPVAGNTGAALIVREDCVIAEELARALVRTPNVILGIPGPGSGEHTLVAAHARAADVEAVTRLLEAGTLAADAPVPAGVRLLTAQTLGSSYDDALRKRAAPLVLSLPRTAPAEVEKRTFAAVYKGATDFVTKWCWPVPARWVTRWAAARGIRPNTVTTASLVLVVVATWLFARGNWLLGIPVAWAMTFLDTVDGKLARVTLTSSRWGNLYDHGIDLLHPPFWWWAWYHGMLASAPDPMLPYLQPAFAIVIGGYVLGRILEGAFVYAFGIQMHVWGRIDSWFRTITARRNPNLALLTLGAICGRADVGFLAVAIWTVLSLAFHLVRFTQALGYRLRGGTVRSWMSAS